MSASAPEQQQIENQPHLNNNQPWKNSLWLSRGEPVTGWEIETQVQIAEVLMWWFIAAVLFLQERMPEPPVHISSCK